MNVVTKLMVAGVVAVAPAAASAAIVTTFAPGWPLPSPAAPVAEDIEAGQEYPYQFTATGTDSQNFTFTALEKLNVLGVSFTSNGTAADVAKTGVAFKGGPLTAFAPVGLPNAATGSQTFGGFSMMPGDTFSFLLDVNGVTETALLTARFETTAVPVPAALPLMLGGIAALGAVSRKKKKA